MWVFIACRLILRHKYVYNGMFVRAGVKSEHCRQIPDSGDKANLLNGDGTSSAVLNASRS